MNLGCDLYFDSEGKPVPLSRQELKSSDEVQLQEAFADHGLAPETVAFLERATASDDLDEDSPLWLVNEQIKGLLEGDGASEDHANVVAFLLETGLPRSTVDRIHRAIVKPHQEQQS